MSKEGIETIKVLYELKGMVKSNFEDTKGELLEIKDHLNKLNGQVSSNTKFKNKSLGGLKIIGFLLGGGIITFILTKIL